VYITKKVKPGYNLKIAILVGEKDEGTVKIKNLEDDGSFDVIFYLFVFSYK
jgi:hypothetical protein